MRTNTQKWMRKEIYRSKEEAEYNKELTEEQGVHARLYKLKDESYGVYVAQ